MMPILKREIAGLMMACALVLTACSSNTTEVRSGSMRDVAADEDGDVQVTLAECPPAVQATILQHVGDGVINEIERAPSGNYEVEVAAPNESFEFVVAGDGTYLGDDDDGDDDDDDEDDD